jgi:hypothetical protein
MKYVHFSKMVLVALFLASSPSWAAGSVELVPLHQEDADFDALLGKQDPKNLPDSNTRLNDAVRKAEKTSPRSKARAGARSRGEGRSGPAGSSENGARRGSPIRRR